MASIFCISPKSSRWWYSRSQIVAYQVGGGGRESLELRRGEGDDYTVAIAGRGVAVAWRGLGWRLLSGQDGVRLVFSGLSLPGAWGA